MKTKLFFLIPTVLSLTVNAERKVPEFHSDPVFTENRGQVHDQNNVKRSDVLFSGYDGGMTYHFKKEGFSYQQYRVDSWKDIKDNNANTNTKAPNQTTIYRSDFVWLNAKEDVEISGGKRIEQVKNFINGDNKITGVKNYNEITYVNLYDGIDVTWYHKNGHLKYDYHVKPGADYKQIQIKVKGVSKLLVNKKGELVMQTPFGEIVEEAPYVTQANKKLSSKWILKGKVISFEIKGINPSLPYIIDPAVRQWGTYYGGGGNETGYGCATDGAGNVFIAGYTDQNSGGTTIATIGAYQTVVVSGWSAFVAKINSAGARQWGTYFSGSWAGEIGYGCATDNSGNVYVTGVANSPIGIANGTPHQNSLGGNQDAFLAKFNSSGVMQWSTYYGGTESEGGRSCTTDGAGNVYICGQTSSTLTNVVATSGSHQDTYGGGNDAFLVKFNSSGVRQWATYYGGTGSETANECVTDGSGNVYLVGGTGSIGGTAIATASSHQPTTSGGGGFLAKFDGNGVRQWASYYGNGEVYSCATDGSGNVYIVGYGTSAGTLIASTGAYQTSGDAFVAKFNSSGGRQWGTYFGGSSNEAAWACAVDVSANVYISGSTASGSGISSSVAFQSNYGGGTTDAFLIKFNTSGAYQWGTYYGGSDADVGWGLSIDPLDNIFMGGVTRSSFVMGSPSVHQVNHGGGADDAFVAKFKDCNITSLNASSNAPVCQGANLNLSGSVTSGLSLTYSWTGPNSYTSALQNPVISGITVVGSNNYTFKVDDGNGCYFTKQVSVYVDPTPTITVSSGTICAGQSFTIDPQNAYTYTITGGQFTVSPGGTTSYTITGTSFYGCAASNSAVCTVSVKTVPNVTITPSSTVICSANTVTLVASGASTYTWSNGLGNSPTVTPGPNSNFSRTVIGTAVNGCTDQAVQSISVNTSPSVSITPSNTVVCSGKTVTLTASGANTYTWTSGPVATVNPVSPNVTTNYTVTGTNSTGGCTDTAVQSISVNASPTINIGATSTVICSGKSATLTASNANTYTWTNGPATTTVLVVSPMATTIYTVTGTSAVGGCTDNAVQSISVNASPTINIAATSTVVCSGKSATLTASNANTYTWTNGPATTTVLVVSPMATTIYTVTGTSAVGGCTDNAVQSVSVNASPTINIAASSTVICSGKTATLTANNANTYTWTNGPATTTVLVVSPMATTIYTVTGTSAVGGCTDNAVQSISVNASPTINIASTSTVVCSGKSATLTASNANTYTWTNGPATTTVLVVSPMVTTIYTVTGTSAVGGCTDNAVQSISVNASPTINIAATSTVICSGKIATLTASNANTYTWTNGPATTTILAVSPMATTIYTVTGTSAVGGCTDNAVQSISVNASPTINIAATSTVICSGKTATLTASNANTYTWTNGPATTTILAVSPMATTIYTVTGTSATGGCTDTAVQSVSVNASPTINIAATSTVICSGKSATLTASNANTYTWTNGPATTTILAVSPMATTIYTVTGTSATGGCTDTAVQSVSVNASPTINIAATSTVICSGKSATLTASNANTYTWTNGPATTTILTVSPMATTIYTVTGTSAAGGCTGTAVQNVSVNASPTINIAATSTVICSGKTTTLTASNANTYTWTNGPATTTVLAVSPIATTIYTVTGTTAAGGCTGTAVQNVSVNTSPTINIAATSTVICTGKTATLTASNANTYTWTNGPATTTVLAVSPMITTIYTVTGTSATGGCTGTAVQNVSVNASPTINIAATSTVICAGGTTTLTASNANTYTWMPGPVTGTTISFGPIVPTIYTVTGTNATGGCTGTAVQNILVNAPPALTITPTSSVVCPGETTTLVVTGANTYSWTGGSSTATNIVSPLVPTLYTATGTLAATGCTSSANQIVLVSTPPVIVVTPTSTTICSGNTASFTASGASTYSWTGGPGTAGYTVNPTSPANYTVTGTSAATGCSATAVASVATNPNPTVTVNSGTICIGNSFTITANGATTYSWNTGANTSSINVTPATNTTYIATGTDANNCVNSATATVVVLSALVVNIVPSSTAICSGNSVTLTANGANTFSWSNSATSTSIVVSPSVTTSYSVIGLSGIGCSNTALQTIAINPTPTITISGNTLVCSGSPSTLTASGALTYTWNPAPANFSVVVSPTITSIYNVSGSNSFSCVGNASFQVNTPPVVTPSICMVTVDSLSINNEIYWEKMHYPQADTFIVYREVSASVYLPIARISKNDLGFYPDTNRSVGLNNGNPNFTSYKYKLQFVDTCGNLSPMSPYHQSIFIQDNQTGNFSWNYYFIEGVGPIQTVNYILWRQNVLSGVTTTIGGTSGTAFTDPQYASLAQSGNVKWYVSTSGFDCDPALRLLDVTGKKTGTKSNATNERQFPAATIGIKTNVLLNKNITMYPNPTENELTIDFGKEPVNLRLEMTDPIGRIIKSEIITGTRYHVNTEKVSNGVYFIRLYEKGGAMITQKIIVQHQ